MVRARVALPRLPCSHTSPRATATLPSLCYRWAVRRLGVADEATVDDVGEPSLEIAQRFRGVLPSASLRRKNSRPSVPWRRCPHVRQLDVVLLGVAVCKPARPIHQHGSYERRARLNPGTGLLVAQMLADQRGAAGNHGRCHAGTTPVALVRVAGIRGPSLTGGRRARVRGADKRAGCGEVGLDPVQAAAWATSTSGVQACRVPRQGGVGDRSGGELTGEPSAPGLRRPPRVDRYNLRRRRGRSLRWPETPR